MALGGETAAHAFAHTFDSIRHQRLFERVHELPLPDSFFALLARWVRCECYDGRSIRRIERGVPQG